MSSWQFGIDLVTTFLLASYLLFHYGNFYKHHVFVTLSVLVAFYFSFVFVFVLPIDISATVYRQCLSAHANDTAVNTTVSSTTPLPNLINATISSSLSNTSLPLIITQPPPPCVRPSSFVQDTVLINLWRVVYWLSMLLTWLVLPLSQSYVQAGEFTVKGKLKSALMDNAIYYGSYLFICGVLLAYIAVKPELQLDWQKLKAIASSASNTWGLFLLVFMLGYGLVSVPQALYHGSCEKRSLGNAYFRVAKLGIERSNAEESVDDVIETLQLCVKSTNSLPPHLANNLQTIVSALPLEFRERMARRRVNETINEVNEKLLVKLHRNVKRALQAYQRTEFQYEAAVTHAIYLEDVERNLRSNARVFKHTFDESRSRGIWGHLPSSFEWFVRCIAHSYALKFLSVTAALLSFMIIWSEVTFFNKSPVLSFFALMLNSTRSAYSYMELISTITISYMATCAFYTIFKIRVFNFYYLARNHLTDEYSLIFAGMLLCRLTPPLCLNTLSLFQLDSHVVKTRQDLTPDQERALETSYTQVMGHMDVITLISDGFNVYFPIGILLIAILTWFRVGARILSKVGFQQFLPEDDDGSTDELVAEGGQLVLREKRRRQRSLDSSSSARKYTSRRAGGLGGGSSLDRSTAADSANVAVENLRNLTHNVQQQHHQDPQNDAEETYYSRVLIEDSSSSSSRPPPSYGTRDSSRYYYQQQTRDQAPRNLFDDV